jgi:ribosome modulation factor
MTQTSIGGFARRSPLNTAGIAGRLKTQCPSTAS